MIMKRFKYYIAIILLGTLTLLSLSACSSSESETDSSSGSAVSDSDAHLTLQSKYVKAYLDALCKEDYKTYADVCGVSAEDVKNDFPEYLESIVSSELTYVPSDAMITTFAKELKKIFAACQYTVEPSKENKDGSFTIPVSFQQLTIFKPALKKANKEYDTWADKQPDDLDEDKATDQFFEYIIKHCEEELKNPQYAAATTVNVTLNVPEGEESTYEYNEGDIDNLLYGLLDFSAWDEDVADEETVDTEDEA